MYLNNVRVEQVTRAVVLDDLLFGQYALLRHGKKQYAVVIAR